MTGAIDDDAVEEAFEAFLAGRGVPGAGDAGIGRLVAFTDAVRAGAHAPGRPSAALAELLSTGLLTDQPSPSARTTRSAGRPAPRAAGRGRRRRSRMFASALFAKLASAGLAAKAATVAGVAVVGVSTAGFTGALPDPVQHSFATVVDGATPFTAPDPAPSATTAVTDPATGSGATPSPTEADGSTTQGDSTSGDSTSGDSTQGDSATPDGGGHDPAPGSATPFGRQVSQMAHEGHDGKPGVDGQAVSSMARARHSGDSTGTTGSTGSGDSAASPAATVTAAPTPASHGASGKGHGNH